MASPARIRATIASVTTAPDELRELRAFHKALADVNRLRLCAAWPTVRPPWPS